MIFVPLNVTQRGRGGKMDFIDPTSQPNGYYLTYNYSFRRTYGYSIDI